MSELPRPPGRDEAAGPGWYEDPWRAAPWRWWDGLQWTRWTAPPAVRTPPPGSPGAPIAGSALPDPEPAAGRAVPVTDPRGRRRLVVELVIVLAVFPLPYVVSALESLTAYLLGKGAGRRVPVLFPGHIAAGFPFVLLAVLLPLSAAALVLYLISQPGGDGGPTALGLDGRKLRADLALVLPIFLLCDLVPIAGGGVLLHALGIRGPAPSTGVLPAYYDVVYVAMAAVAGVVEELVVLGYLVRRLEQIGLRPIWVVVIAVAVRGSYHLYYGWGVLPILVWATASVLVYRRFRRLGPFIIVHICWDVGLFFVGPFLIGEILVLTPLSVVASAMWWRYLPPRASRRSEPELEADAGPGY